MKQIPNYIRDKQKEGNFASICPQALQELAIIHLEGDEKYGYANWIKLKKTPLISFRYDTVNHILKHLILYCLGDRKEKHLAKVMWGCQALIHHDEKCKHQEILTK